MTFIEEAVPLFGKTYEAPEITELLSHQPEHKADKPSDGDQYIICRKGGFDLLFQYRGEARHSIKNRLLVAIFLYPEGKDRHNQFSGALPYGFLMTDSRETLHSKKLPDLTWVVGEGQVDKNYSEPDSEIWILDEYSLHVDYNGSMEISCIVISPPKTDD
jgi:hypothetical protein